MFSVEAVVSAPRCVCVLQCTHPCWRPVPRCSQHHPLLDEQVFETLYGKKAAALYTQAGDYQKTARFYYKKAEDTYYQANNWASYDDWRRARHQWDYFYSREFPCECCGETCCMS